MCVIIYIYIYIDTRRNNFFIFTSASLVVFLRRFASYIRTTQAKIRYFGLYRPDCGCCSLLLGISCLSVIQSPGWRSVIRPLIRLSIVIGIEAQIAHLWCLFWPPAACVLWLLALLFWLSFCSFTIHGSSVFRFCFHFFLFFWLLFRDSGLVSC